MTTTDNPTRVYAHIADQLERDAEATASDDVPAEAHAAAAAYAGQLASWYRWLDAHVPVLLTDPDPQVIWLLGRLALDPKLRSVATRAVPALDATAGRYPAPAPPAALAALEGHAAASSVPGPDLPPPPTWHGPEAPHEPA